jgi:hypothetical protein
VFHRLAHSKISRQRERRDELCQPQVVLAHATLICRANTA